MRGFDNPTERMKHTGQAIRDAAEKGGYGYRWWKANDIEHNEGYNALPMRSLTEHLNDPNFWKALEAIERDVAAVAREPNISRNISRKSHGGTTQVGASLVASMPGENRIRSSKNRGRLPSASSPAMACSNRGRARS